MLWSLSIENVKRSSSLTGSDPVVSGSCSCFGLISQHLQAVTRISYSLLMTVVLGRIRLSGSHLLLGPRLRKERTWSLLVGELAITGPRRFEYGRDLPSFLHSRADSDVPGISARYTVVAH